MPALWVTRTSRLWGVPASGRWYIACCRSRHVPRPCAVPACPLMLGERTERDNVTRQPATRLPSGRGRRWPPARRPTGAAGCSLSSAHPCRCGCAGGEEDAREMGRGPVRGEAAGWTSCRPRRAALPVTSCSSGPYSRWSASQLIAQSCSNGRHAQAMTRGRDTHPQRARLPLSARFERPDSGHWRPLRRDAAGRRRGGGPGSGWRCSPGKWSARTHPSTAEVLAGIPFAG